jgi:Zn-dependent protease
MLVMLFGVVFLHELGHSLVARRFGIRVLDITFWPLGGMARMSEIPESSKVEGLIAVAGPVVNFALAALATPVLIALGAVVETSTGVGAALLMLTMQFIGINLVLGVFNLIPAFPMDGGRVLRAILGRGGDWVRATEQAVKVGRVFAVLMVLAGLFLGRGLIILPLIGLFVWFAGSRELWAVRMRHARSPFAFAFGGPGGPGSFSQTGVPPPPRPGPPPHDADGGARRPGEDWDPGSAPRIDGGPMTTDQIERLERFKGRLFGPRE